MLIPFRKDSYNDEARWVGFRKDNCTDPKLLYENIVGKAEDFIAYINYYYFNKDKSDKIRPTDENADEIWKSIGKNNF